MGTPERTGTGSETWSVQTANTGSAGFRKTSNFENHADGQQECFQRLCLLILLIVIRSIVFQKMHVSDTCL